MKTRLFAVAVSLLLLTVPSLVRADASAAPSVSAGSAEGLIPLQFPSSPVSDFLALYENLSGKTLIRDANLAGGPNLSIVSKQRVTKTEALRTIESVLLLNGYSLIPGPDGTVKVVNFGSGGKGDKSPRSEGVHVYTNLADIPLGDQLVGYYMPLQFASPSDAAAILQGSITLHSYGTLIPVPNAQAIVLTEDAAVIRELARLKDLIDVPPAKVMSQFVDLKRADAERVCESLTKLLEAQKKGGQPSGNSSAAAGAAGQFENKLVAGDLQLVPDSRTNRILVITRPVNFPFVRDLIQQFDQSIEQVKPYTRSLKYVSASDMVPVLQNLLAESKDDASSAASSAAARQAQAPASRASAGNGGNTSYGGGGTATGSGDTGQSDLGDQPNDVPPQAIIVGKTRIIADNKTNVIMVIGPPENIAKAQDILDQLDIPPRQVYLATVIGKLDVTNSSELSVDLLQNYVHAGNTGVATSSMNSASLTRPTLSPLALTNPGAFPFIGGMSVYGALGNTLDYYVRALESTGRFTITNRPSLATSNNKKAVLASGQRIPIPTSTLSSLDTSSLSNVAQQSNVEYQDVELKLEVIPLINSDKEVTLQIAQTNDTPSGGSTTISGNTIPTINTDKLLTTITVSNRHTFVLGGLIRDSDQNNRTGTPLLSRIPVLGALFRSDTKTRERTELVILIEPIVAENDKELIEASAIEQNVGQMGNPSAAYMAKPVPVVDKKSTALESLTH